MTDEPWKDFAPQEQGPWNDFKQAGKAPALSSAPIGDLPPDFGQGTMTRADLPESMRDAAPLPKPGDVLPGLGDMFVENAKGLLTGQPFLGVAGSGTSADVARTLASKLPVAPAASGLAGIFTGLGNELVPAYGGTPDLSAADAANKTAEALSYQPQTGLGKAVGGAIDLPFEALSGLGGAVGEKTLDKTNSPVLATLADTAVQSLPFLFGGEAAREVKPTATDLRATERVTPTDAPPSPAAALQAMTDGIKQQLQSLDQQPAAPAPPSPKPRFSGEQVARGEHLENANGQRGPGNGANGAVVDRVQGAAPTGAAVEAPATAPTVEPEPVQAPETPADGAPAEAVEPPQAAPLPDFTAEQRRATAAQGMADKVQGLTDEQKAQIAEHYPPVTKDRVTGYDRAEELDPTIEAAQKAGGPAAYGEVDVRNLGGLNAHAGSNAKANVHFRAAADIIREEAQKAGVNVALIRKSAGDEFGVVAHGVDSATLSGVLEKARTRIEDYAKANGLDAIPNPKGGAPGFGIHYGTSDIVPGASIRDILVHADALVEQRKKGQGVPYEQRTPTEASGAGQGAARAVAASAGEDAVGRGAADRGSEAEATASDTSVRNAATAVDRATHGMEPLEGAEHKGWEQSKAEAAKALANDPNYAKNLAREVLESKRPITDAETMALGAERHNLEAAYAANDDAILKARDAGDQPAEIRALAQKADLEAQLDANHRATQSGGTELARAMAARNAQIARDYSTARTLTRGRVAYGDKFGADVEKQLREASEGIAAADKEVQDAQKSHVAEQLDANAKEQTRLQKQIDDMEAKLAKRLKACPI